MNELTPVSSGVTSDMDVESETIPSPPARISIPRPSTPMIPETVVSAGAPTDDNQNMRDALSAEPLSRADLPTVPRNVYLDRLEAEVVALGANFTNPLPDEFGSVFEGMKSDLIARIAGDTHFPKLPDCVVLISDTEPSFLAFQVIRDEKKPVKCSGAIVVVDTDDESQVSDSEIRKQAGQMPKQPLKKNPPSFQQFLGGLNKRSSSSDHITPSGSPINYFAFLPIVFTQRLDPILKPNPKGRSLIATPMRIFIRETPANPKRKNRGRNSTHKRHPNPPLLRRLPRPHRLTCSRTSARMNSSSMTNRACGPKANLEKKTGSSPGDL